MDWGALYPEATKARTTDQLAQVPTFAPADQGAFSNFGTGAGSYFMRGMAETARTVSMAGAVVPIIADKLIGDDNKGESLTDAYFKTHDEVFQGAVDYWTPKAGTVGKAGEIVGQLASGILKFIASPAVTVADQQMSTAIDLTRQGVDTGAALVAGDIAGLSTVVGVALPFVGSTLGRKVASGIAGNLVPNMIEAQAKSMVLNAAGSPEQAKQFDPLDVNARALDVLMGAAFGGAAHYLSKTGQRDFQFTDEQKNALLTVNQGRHMERSGDQTNDVALSQHVQDMRASVDQLLRGEPVNVPDRAVPDAVLKETADIHDEIVRVAAEDAKPPIERPDMHPATQPEAKPGEVSMDPAEVQAKATIEAMPDLRIPTGEVKPDGTDVTIPAADYLAKVKADAAGVESQANLFRTAAECLLGAL